MKAITNGTNKATVHLKSTSSRASLMIPGDIWPEVLENSGVSLRYLPFEREGSELHFVEPQELSIVDVAAHMTTCLLAGERNASTLRGVPYATYEARQRVTDWANIPSKNRSHHTTPSPEVFPRRVGTTVGLGRALERRLSILRKDLCCDCERCNTR